eukprot:UN1708
MSLELPQTESWRARKIRLIPWLRVLTSAGTYGSPPTPKKAGLRNRESEYEEDENRWTTACPCASYPDGQSPVPGSAQGRGPCGPHLMKRLMTYRWCSSNCSCMTFSS